jgi:protein tyrosine phosphatase (PTP) superfamily phosphohydrolase (DUF442 family)
MHRASLVLVAAALLCGAAASGAPQQHGADHVHVQPEPAHPRRLATEHLHNVVRIHEKVISGAQPDGDEAFSELRALGVKTIISVDGAKPDVEAARKYGLRYVHLPIGYDGVPDKRVKELAKAVRDLPGPVYIHCHHGKHRSPAAATVACVSAGLVSSRNAVAVLQVAGTSPRYLGLFESTTNAHRLEDKLLDALNVEFRETIDVPPLAEAMVAIEHTHDHLKLLSSTDWKQSPEHPDLDPAHEALLLREHFTELLRSDELKQQPIEFQRLAQHAETACQHLENVVRNWKAAEPSSPPPKEIAVAFDQLSNHCASCHRRFRDVPLREKTSGE